MTLPKSLGDTKASAEQLLAESRALENPYGVPVLKIEPAQFEDIAKKNAAGKSDEEQKKALQSNIRELLKVFFHYVAEGDAQKEAKLNAVVFEGAYMEDFKHRKEYLYERTAASALNPDYGDAHALCVQETEGSEPLAGVIVMPRSERTYQNSAQNLTDVKGSQFAPPSVPVAQLGFMTRWHEYSHTVGADEAQADKMAAIMTRKAFPGSNVLQVYADLRAIDSLLDYNSQPKIENGIETRPPRHAIYGWRLVDAIDEVAGISESELRKMDENAIRQVADTPIANTKHGALRRVGEALKEIDPILVNSKEVDIRQAGDALKGLLDSGKFDGDPDAQAIAKRSLLAISRVALDGPKLDADLGVTSRFMQQKETPVTASPMHKQTLKAPSL